MRAPAGMTPRSSSRRPGFTLVEMLVAAIIVGVMMSVALPAVGNSIIRARIDKAAATVASDLQQAFSYANRQRKPIRLSWSSTSWQFTIADRSTSTVYLTRQLGASNSEFKASSVSFSPATVDFFPNGLASSALTVTVGAGSYSRQVTMSRAGRIRVVPR